MRFLKQIVISVLLLNFTVCHAVEYNYNGVIYRVDGSEATVCRIEDYIEEVAILKGIKGGYPVTKIGQEAFKGNSYVKYLIIPNTVTSIGYGAFADCTQLKELILPDNASVLLENELSLDANKLSPIKGCVNLKSIKGNTIKRPAYFDTELNYDVPEVPFFNPNASRNKQNVKRNSGTTTKRISGNRGVPNNAPVSSTTSTSASEDNMDILRGMIAGDNPDSQNVPNSEKQISTKKLSQKSIKSLTDNAKQISGDYYGVGILSQNKEIIEKYSKISIVMSRIDRNNVGVNVYENGEIPFFNDFTTYKISKTDNGFLLTNIEIPSATIKIIEGKSMEYVHPKVGIDDGIYQLTILIGEGNMSLNKGSSGNNEDSEKEILTHVVSAGETYMSIAKKYNVNVKDLKDWNQIPAKTPASAKADVGEVLTIFKN